MQGRHLDNAEVCKYRGRHNNNTGSLKIQGETPQCPPFKFYRLYLPPQAANSGNVALKDVPKKATHNVRDGLYSLEYAN